MGQLPKVTVIIPLFNREKYIGVTIQSVLNQTYKNIEIIVVDDGCKDNSREIIEKYRGRIKILEHDGRTNKGQSAAINLGLRNSSGEYIAILDSDDLFASDKICRQVKYLIENPQVGTVYANGMNINAEGKLLYKIFADEERPLIGPEPVLLYSAFNLPSNALVRKSVFDRAGFFNENYRSAQDHDMAIRIAEIAPVGYINDCLWYYRRHNDSIRNKRTLERWKNGFHILSAACSRYHYSPRIILKRKAVLHFRIAQCYFDDNCYIKCFINLFLAFLYDPGRSLTVMLKKEIISSPKS